MKEEKDTIRLLLLSWVRTYYFLTRNTGNKDELEKELYRTEDYLMNQSITQLKIIHQSTDYYTLQYYQDNGAKIKQFSAEEVEGYL